MSEPIEMYRNLPQYAGQVRECAMCHCTVTIFDADLCDNCDRILNGILTVISEHGGSDPTSCVKVADVFTYLSNNKHLEA